MKRLKIGFDMDGILVDLTPHWLQCIAEDYGVHVRMSEIDQWSLHKCGELQSLGAKTVYDYLHRPGFFRYAPPIAPALEVFKRMAKEHDVFIISSPSSAISAKEKVEWLAEHLPDVKMPNICLFPTKTMVKLDVLIDDHPETVVQYRAEWPDSLVLGIEYEYNKHVPTTGALQIFSCFRKPDVAWEKIEGRIDSHAHRGDRVS
jgi:5'(3')-deoxyribonucleotidase